MYLHKQHFMVHLQLQFFFITYTVTDLLLYYVFQVWEGRDRFYNIPLMNLTTVNVLIAL